MSEEQKKNSPNYKTTPTTPKSDVPKSEVTKTSPSPVVSPKITPPKDNSSLPDSLSKKPTPPAASEKTTIIKEVADDKADLSIKEALNQQQEQRRKENEKRKILWRKSSTPRQRQTSPYKFKLIEVKRVTKVTKGGRRFRFFAVALAGDQKGQVGVGYGKANEVRSARAKAFAVAEKNLFRVPLHNETILHEVTGKFCSSRILLKPAPPGSGIIVGGASRSVIELLGIKNIRGKSLGSNNKMNVIQATLLTLKKLKTKKEIEALRADDEQTDNN